MMIEKLAKAPPEKTSAKPRTLLELREDVLTRKLASCGVIRNRYWNVRR